MKERRGLILSAIIKTFIDSATPVGSKMLGERFDLDVSSATIRNEMSALETEGYLASPHTSAGRIPTEKGFRFFVANVAQSSTALRPKVEAEFMQNLQQHLQQKRLDQDVSDIITVLNNMTRNVVFASVPSQERMFFLGLGSVLEQPEFAQNALMASGVFRILEEGFYDVLQELHIPHGAPQIYIGSDNLMEEIQSCSIVAGRYQIGGVDGFVGILGPMRMDYGKNLALIELAQQYLESKNISPL